MNLHRCCPKQRDVTCHGPLKMTNIYDDQLTFNFYHLLQPKSLFHCKDLSLPIIISLSSASPCDLLQQIKWPLAKKRRRKQVWTKASQVDCSSRLSEMNELKTVRHHDDTRLPQYASDPSFERVILANAPQKNKSLPPTIPFP